MRPLAPLAVAALFLATALSAGIAPPPAAAAEPVGHDHGTGRLTIRFQGPVLILDLTVPAVDIVGFEHAPRIDEDFTEIAQARTALQDPGQMVALPVAAGCAVDRAEADFVPATASSDDQAHAVFNVLHELSCAEPSQLTGLSVPLFHLYPSLTRIEVRLIAGDAHRDVTVTRDRPRLDLTR